MPDVPESTKREAVLTPDDAARRVALARDATVGEVQKVIVGHEDLIEFLLIALFSRGHVLIGGRSGSARTQLLSTFAKTLNLKFRHFLMSGDTTQEDVTGYEVDAEDNGATMRRIVRGPIFSELLAADGIDQACRRTQAELIHGVRHGRVVISGKTYELEEPRFVCATHDGNSPTAISPLTEKQLDQFMFAFDLGYPTEQEEREIVVRRLTAAKAEVRVVLRSRDILWVRQLVDQMPVVRQTIDYAVDLVRATRPEGEGVPNFVKNWIDFGAGPRASEQLVIAAKARALLKGRSLVHSADIRAVSRQVLRHRIFLNREAKRHGITVDQVVDKIVAVVKERWANAAEGPANLVVVADPAGQAAAAEQTPILGAQPAQPVLPNQPTNPVLPNHPFMTPQPPSTSAWPTSAESAQEQGASDTAPKEQSHWPPGESPSER
jgi:MoxR-like ATPase